ncbi:MAG: hypothetical protein ACE5G0_20990 [Rhodothermales bacterium]
MSTSFQSKQEDVWTRIETEKRRDRLVRRISIVSWTVTFAILVVFTAMIGVEVSRTLDRLQVGVVGPEAVISALMPLIAVVGTVSLLIAVLSTVGVFLRLRTASLHEIQLRLAALEEMLLTRPTPEGSGEPS